MVKYPGVLELILDNRLDKHRNSRHTLPVWFQPNYY